MIGLHSFFFLFQFFLFFSFLVFFPLLFLFFLPLFFLFLFPFDSFSFPFLGLFALYFLLFLVPFQLFCVYFVPSPLSPLSCRGRFWSSRSPFRWFRTLLDIFGIFIGKTNEVILLVGIFRSRVFLKNNLFKHHRRSLGAEFFKKRPWSASLYFVFS